jgi:type II secretory ATPase GspE/PulE/Tfp pilus assembly ATPase PilB-like protein
LIKVSPVLRAAIAENMSMAQLKKHMPEDFDPMRVDGMSKAARGETTVQEVLRATQDVDEA